jgi:hypothetical protein
MGSAAFHLARRPFDWLRSGTEEGLALYAVAGLVGILVALIALPVLCVLALATSGPIRFVAGLAGSISGRSLLGFVNAFSRPLHAALLICRGRAPRHAWREALPLLELDVWRFHYGPDGERLWSRFRHSLRRPLASRPEPEAVLRPALH